VLAVAVHYSMQKTLVLQQFARKMVIELATTDLDGQIGL
jgi:hypothetical protein